MVRGRLQSNGLQTLQTELHFGVLGILLGCEEWEREKLPRVFEKQQCLLHHISNKFNVHVQHLTLLKATKAAAVAPPLHGEERVQSEGACCSVSVCTVNPNLPINNYCSMPDFFPECTDWKQRRQSELPTNVSFLALFLFQCVFTVCLSWFVCGKLLNWYLQKQIERLHTLYARCSTTSSWLLWDQSARLGRKFFCSLWRSHRETVALVLCGSFALVGPQTREGNWTSLLSEFTCQWSHSSSWCQSCCSLLVVAILPWSKLGRNSFQVLCTGGLVSVYCRT